MLRSLSFFFFFALGSLSASAAEYVDPWQSVRQLGMGGVYIFQEKDAASFLQNPAYACYTKGFNWIIFDVNLGTIADTETYQTISDIGTSFNQASDLLPMMGRNMWLGFGGHSTFTMPCFGASAWDYGYMSFFLRNPAFPNLDFGYQNDYALQAGGGIPLSPVLTLGMSVKRVVRRAADLVLGTDTIATISSNTLEDSIQDEGSAYGIDMGLVSRFENLPFNPTVSMAWRDVGSTAFQKTAGASAPKRQKDNLIFGFSFDGEVPLLGFGVGAEFRHVTDQGEPFGKKVHLGAELNLMFFDLRAGFYQGYTTYGVGIDLWLLRMDAAYYAVERGAYPGQTPDQRAQISLSMNLSFDPDFRLTDAGGKRRKLKQRR